MIYFLVIGATLFLAYSNGANDNFKGVATLLGSGTTTFRQSLNWATLMTVLGSVTSVFLAQQLVSNFSGKGLVPDEIISTPAFTIAVAGAAALTVMIATRLGLPVSTTHGLVGALVGAGLMAAPDQINLSKLGKSFLLPLIGSPLLAALTSFLLYLIFRYIRKSLGLKKVPSDSPWAGPGAKVSDEKAFQNSIEVYPGKIFSIQLQSILNVCHFITSGIVCFARALNDTPKIVGLLLFINLFDIRLSLLVVAAAMAVGGLLNSRKIAETMSTKITALNPGQGFTANLVTGILVSTASFSGLPVSTTHVSVGALFGIATVTREANVKVISGIILSWVLTLPIATAFSATIYFLLTKML